MTRFSYKARDSDNKLVTGSLERESREEVLEWLRELNLTPIQVTQTPLKTETADRSLIRAVRDCIFWMRHRVSQRQVAGFTKRLSLMLELKIPMMESLEQAAAQGSNRLKKTVRKVISDIHTEYSLADAVSKYPAAFSSIYISAIYSSEKQRNLDINLGSLAVYLDKILELNSRWENMLKRFTYTFFLLVILAAVILQGLVSGFEVINQNPVSSLPPSTRVILQACQLLREYFWTAAVILLLLMLVAYLEVLILKKIRVAQAIYSKFPVLSRLLKTYTWTVLCRTLSFLLRNGFTVLQAVQISFFETSSKGCANKLKIVASHLQNGESLNASLEKCQGFPKLLSEIVKSGEQLGKLEDHLEKAAALFEAEYEARIVNLERAFIKTMLSVTAFFTLVILLFLLWPML
jgi:type II secretory pathway component PulF